MMTTARPYAYIRRSNQGAPEAMDRQIADVRDLVERVAPEDAPALVVLTGDWARSGATESTAKRLDFIDLMEAVERGEVSTLYAKDADRLARSVEWASRLWNACKRVGTVIVTTSMTFRPADPADNAGWSVWHYEAVKNETYVRDAQRKAGMRVTRQRKAGTILGQPPYGDRLLADGTPEPWRAVVDAFKEAGTYGGAVKLLTARGVPSRRAHLGMGWEASTVLRIIRHAVKPIAEGGRGVTDVILPTTTKRGVYTVGTHLFTRLLICPHDDSIMTTIPHKGGRATSYSCRVGHRDVTHPRPYIISESAILPLVKSWVAMVVKAQTHKVDMAGIVTNMTALMEERSRIIAYGLKGRLTEVEVDAKLAEIDGTLGNLESVKRSAVTIEYGIDWDAPVGIINARLRELFAGIRLAYADVAAGEVVKGRHTRTRTLVVGQPVWRIEHPERFDVELPDDAEVREIDHRKGPTFPVDPKLVKAATRKARKR